MPAQWAAIDSRLVGKGSASGSRQATPRGGREAAPLCLRRLGGAALLSLGLSDCFRRFDQPAASYSWWDYRAAGFRRNAGRFRFCSCLGTQGLCFADLGFFGSCTGTRFSNSALLACYDGVAW